jgi:hypothetical protein
MPLPDQVFVLLSLRIASSFQLHLEQVHHLRQEQDNIRRLIS